MLRFRAKTQKYRKARKEDSVGSIKASNKFYASYLSHLAFGRP
jgi:hypothetical protein